MADFKVRCVDTNTKSLTVGKIYEVKNGHLTFDDGDTSVYPVKNFQDFQRVFESKFELVPEPQQFTKADLKTGDILINGDFRYKVIKDSCNGDYAMDYQGFTIWFKHLTDNLAESLPSIKKVDRPVSPTGVLCFYPNESETIWQRSEPKHYTISEAEAKLSKIDGQAVKIGE